MDEIWEDAGADAMTAPGERAGAARLAATPPGDHLDEGIVIVKQKSSAGFREFWIHPPRSGSYTWWSSARRRTGTTAPLRRLDAPWRAPKYVLRAIRAEKNSALGLFAALARA